MAIDLGRILDALPTMVWSASPDGHINFVNRHLSEHTGLNADEVHRWDWQALVSPDDLQRVLQGWRSIVASGIPGEIEAGIRRWDGTYRPCLVQCSPMHDDAGETIGWCGTCIDVEDLRRADDTLRLHEPDLQLIVDGLPVPVTVTAPSGKVEHLNRPALDYFGKTSDELEDWKASGVVHPNDLEEAIAAQIEAYQNGSIYSIESRYRRADGIYRRHSVLGMPLRDARGRILRWLHLLTDIDDQKRAGEALRADEQNPQVIIDTIPAMAWSARPDGAAEFFNRHYLNYIGRSLEQSRGWSWSTAVHPDDLGGLTATWQSILASGRPGEAEARFRRFDGEYRWFLLRVSPLRDQSGSIVKWYGTNTDIDDRKHAEDKLRRSELLLAEGQRISSTGTFSWMVDTDELTFSEELKHIFEFDVNGVVTFDGMSSRVHPEDLPLLAEKIAEVRSGRDIDEYDIRLSTTEGGTRHVKVIGRVIRHESGRLECVGAVRDVTQSRLAAQAHDKLRSELARITRVMSLGAMAASIAHEVNQPLSGIITNADTCLHMLGSEPPNLDGARETARRTIRDGNRAADVITRLRALFNESIVPVEETDLNVATREVISLCWDDLQRARVTLRVEFDDKLPLVRADRVQLQQVIMNLVRNAADAMKGVEERPRQILLRTQLEDDNAVRLSVRDTGTGVSAENVERIFHAFYTTKSDGMGVGLSVSRTIIEKHGGRLWVQPNEVGATFSFVIPARID